MGLVSLGACVAGFVLDFIFGDPVWLYHPVRLIGKWISFLEKLLRRKTGEKRQIAAGGILWILTVAVVYSVTAGILWIVRKWVRQQDSYWRHSGAIRFLQPDVLSAKAERFMSG